MSRARPLPTHLGDTFSVRAALDAGVTPRRLRSELHRPFRSARSVLMPVTTRDRARALMPLLHSDHFFSHLTAAELLGLRLPEGSRPGLIHVTSRDPRRAMRRPGVAGHTSPARATIMRLPDGLPVSVPIDAWCECATLLRLDDLVVMGDGLVQRRDPECSLPVLEQAVLSRAGRRGTAGLRAALTLMRAGTDSARETALRLLIMRAGFPEPQVNGPLRDGRGRVFAHGDLVWPEYGVILEYEGRQHAEDPAQFAIDIRRLNAIAEAGVRVIRIDRELLRRRAELIRMVTAALVECGWRGP